MNNSLSLRKSVQRRGAALGSSPPPQPPTRFFSMGPLWQRGKNPSRRRRKETRGDASRAAPPRPLSPHPRSSLLTFLLRHKTLEPPSNRIAVLWGGTGVGPAADVPQRGGGGRFGTPVLSFRCQHADVSNAELRDAAGLGDPPNFVSPPPPTGRRAENQRGPPGVSSIRDLFSGVHGGAELNFTP